MKRTFYVYFANTEFGMVVLSTLVLFLSIELTVADPQTAVYVRFLSPPHGYTHGLEVHYPGAAPVAKEERLYLPPGNQQNHRQYHHFQNQQSHHQIQQTHHQNQFQNQYQNHNQHQHHQPQNQYHHNNNHDHQQTEAHLHHHMQQQEQQFDSGGQNHYHYPRPNRVFHELGERYITQFPQDHPLPELLYPTGLFQGPLSAADFRREHPGPAFDPELITGSLAQRIVSMVTAHGILYFHEIPHESLVLGNNMERIQNNLLPHRLGSIRPGHPFFNFNK